MFWRRKFIGKAHNKVLTRTRPYICVCIWFIQKVQQMIKHFQHLTMYEEYDTIMQLDKFSRCLIILKRDLMNNWIVKLYIIPRKEKCAPIWPAPKERDPSFVMADNSLRRNTKWFSYIPHIYSTNNKGGKGKTKIMFKFMVI